MKVSDGRAAIMKDGKKYDMIEADALFPYSAYAGNLYSLEYFALVKSRLNPGGLVVNWTPTPRIVRTFLKVFPHVIAFEGIPILMGSDTPIAFDVSVLEERLDKPFTRSRIENAQIDRETLKKFLRTLKVAVFTPELDRSRITDVNTDLFPKDEYLLP